MQYEFTVIIVYIFYSLPQQFNLVNRFRHNHTTILHFFDIDAIRIRIIKKAISHRDDSYMSLDNQKLLCKGIIDY